MSPIEESAQRIVARISRFLAINANLIVPTELKDPLRDAIFEELEWFEEKRKEKLSE